MNLARVRKNEGREKLCLIYFKKFYNGKNLYSPAKTVFKIVADVKKVCNYALDTTFTCHFRQTYQKHFELTTIAILLLHEKQKNIRHKNYNIYVL